MPDPRYYSSHTGAQVDSAVAKVLTDLPYFQAYRSITSATTLTDDDHYVECLSGSFAVGLPLASENNKHTFIIKNSGGGVIVIIPDSGEDIDDESDFTLDTKQAAILYSNGQSWVIIGHYIGEEVGDALTTSPLSQFAATTSAQLAGIISDETGSGSLVFANAPTLVTPVIGNATGSSLILTGTIQQFGLGYDGSNRWDATVASDGEMTMDLVGTDPDFHLKINGTTALFFDASTGNFGVGNFTDPDAPFHVRTTAADAFKLFRANNGNNGVAISFQKLDSVNSRTTVAQIFGAAADATAGAVQGDIAFWCRKAGTLTQTARLIGATGQMGINEVASILGQAHINQSNAAGELPVLYLEQGDVDQPMIALECTIGTGNGVEAVAAKTLTPTHFVKINVAGVGDRYFEVGTIA